MEKEKREQLYGHGGSMHNWKNHSHHTKLIMLDEMKLHWVGEWKEGKSWNNSMKSEGWAFLWARVHGEGGRAKREKFSTASERVRQDRQAQQRFSMETRGQGAKKGITRAKTNHFSENRDGNFSVPETCICLRVEVIGKNSNAELPHYRDISCPHSVHKQTKLLYKYI